VEEQVQWILTYMQEILADIWKENNILKDIKVRKLKFTLAGDFLVELKRKFGEGYDKSEKIRQIEQDLRP